MSIYGFTSRNWNQWYHLIVKLPESVYFFKNYTRYLQSSKSLHIGTWYIIHFRSCYHEMSHYYNSIHITVDLSNELLSFRRVNTIPKQIYKYVPCINTIPKQIYKYVQYKHYHYIPKPASHQPERRGLKESIGFTQHFILCLF